MLIRLFFPKVAFAGRLGRAGFWREMAVSSLTTPIALGLVTYLLQEAARAAEQGMVVDHFKAKAVAGGLLTLYALRNSLVLIGAIKRRMNDVGYSAGSLFRPLVVMVLLVGGLATLYRVPDTAATMHLMALMMIALYVTAIYALGQGVRAVFAVMFAPGHARDAPVTAGSDGGIAASAGGHDVARSVQRLSREMAALIETGPRQLAAWLNEDVVPAKRDKRQRDATPAARSAVRDEEWRARRKERGARRQNQGGSPTGTPAIGFHSGNRRQVAVAVRKQPKSGRSSWYSGLLSGPWG